MAKPVACSHRPIWPHDRPSGLHHLVLAGQRVTLRLDLLLRLLDSRRHRGDGELHARHTRCGQEFLRFRTELRHLVLQPVAQARRNPHGHGLETAREDPTRGLHPHHPLPQ